MSKYAELDRLIIERIRNNPGCSFTWIWSRDVRDESDRLAKLTSHRESFRVVDARLQSLKRACIIEFRRTSAGWRVSTQKEST